MKVLSTKDEQIAAQSFKPCKYTAILVKEGERPAFPVFEETKDGGVKDRTETIFGIIAGDAKTKKVTIELKDLKTNPCDLKKTNPQLGHNISTNVFLLNQNAKIPVVEYNLNKYNTIQQLIEGKDYNIHDNSIALDLKYEYNKSYDTLAEKWLGYSLDAAWDAANLKKSKVSWIVRYFKMDESKAIPYFIPISTCGYPNQVVNINVYPDLEWWVNIKFNSDKPLYVKQQPNYKHKEFKTTDENQNRKKNIEYINEKKQTGLKNIRKGYELQIEAKFN